MNRFHSKCIIRSSVVVAISLAAGTTALAESELTTAFMHQGELHQSGNPVNGSCSIEYSLWQDATGTDPADQVGSAISQTVELSEGLWTIELNAAGEFGPSAFVDEARWLQIDVCCPAPCSNLTTLWPRQLLTASPFALRTRGVDRHSLDADDGDPTDVVFVDAEGNVGISDMTPAQRLSLFGGDFSLQVANNANDASILFQNSVGDYDWRMYSTHPGPSDSHFHIAGGASNSNFNALDDWFTIKNNGFVGIGKNTDPNTSLEVKGDFVIRDPANNGGLILSPYDDGSGGGYGQRPEWVMQSAEMGDGNDSDFHISRNALFDGTYQYIAGDNSASGILFRNNGDIHFRSAPTGTGEITWTDHIIIEGDTGNVGIGTGSPDPSYRLDVAGDVSATAFIGDGSYLTGIFAADVDAVSNADDVEIRADSDADGIGDVNFNVAGAQRMKLDSNQLTVVGTVIVGGDVLANTDVTVSGEIKSTVGGFKLPDGIIIDDAGDLGTTGKTWSLQGDAGTTPGTHFVGTKSDQPLVLKVNNKHAMRLEQNATSPNVIGGVESNLVDAGVYGATIHGGGEDQWSDLKPNKVFDNYGTVSGGVNNFAGSDDSESASATHATVRGGIRNRADGSYATVSGGDGNHAMDSHATVCGGLENSAEGLRSTVGGGWSNTASGDDSTVGGGLFNVADGAYATVPGGEENTATGDSSFAAGRNATAQHAHTFVWGHFASFTSMNPNQFLIDPIATVGINTNTPNAQLHVNGDILASGMITPFSDRRFKKNIGPIANPLEKLSALRGVHYDWKQAEFPKRRFSDGRQVGFIAQEVKEVFPQLVSQGNDEYYSVDYGRLTPAIVEAIKQLHAELEDKDKRIMEMDSELRLLEELIGTLAQKKSGGVQ